MFSDETLCAFETLRVWADFLARMGPEKARAPSKSALDMITQISTCMIAGRSFEFKVGLSLRKVSNQKV